MESILDDRARKAIGDLLGIQSELSAPPAARGGLAAPKISPDVAHELKNAVDRVRLLLWAYIDSREGPDRQLQNSLQKARLERTTEMLHALREDVARGEVPPAPRTHSFIGAVHDMARLLTKRPPG